MFSLLLLVRGPVPSIASGILIVLFYFAEHIGRVARTTAVQAERFLKKVFDLYSVLGRRIHESQNALWNCSVTCKSNRHDGSPVEIPASSQRSVLRRQCGNPAGKSLLRCQCGQLSSTHSKIQKGPGASQPYDQSVAIRPQITTPARSTAQNPYDDK